MEGKDIVFIYYKETVNPQILYVDETLTEFNDDNQLIRIDELAKEVDQHTEGKWDSFSVEVDDGIHRSYNKFDRARD